MSFIGLFVGVLFLLPTAQKAEESCQPLPWGRVALPLLEWKDLGKGRREIVANATTLAAIEQLERDKRLAVVSAVGGYRTGKSFMLNRLVEFATPQQSGGAVADSISDPFTVGHTTRPETDEVNVLLIDACAHPLTGGEPSSLPATSLLLLDTPGLFAPNRPSLFDAQLLACVQLMSSVVLYNSLGVIDRNAVEKLALAVESALGLSFARPPKSNEELENERSPESKQGPVGVSRFNSQYHCTVTDVFRDAFGDVILHFRVVGDGSRGKLQNPAGSKLFWAGGQTLPASHDFSHNDPARRIVGKLVYRNVPTAGLVTFHYGTGKAYSNVSINVSNAQSLSGGEISRPGLMWTVNQFHLRPPDVTSAEYLKGLLREIDSSNAGTTSYYRTLSKFFENMDAALIPTAAESSGALVQNATLAHSSFGTSYTYELRNMFDRVRATAAGSYKRLGAVQLDGLTMSVLVKRWTAIVNVPLSGRNSDAMSYDLLRQVEQFEVNRLEELYDDYVSKHLTTFPMESSELEFHHSTAERLVMEQLATRLHMPEFQHRFEEEIDRQHDGLKSQNSHAIKDTLDAFVTQCSMAAHRQLDQLNPDLPHPSRTFDEVKNNIFDIQWPQMRMNASQWAPPDELDKTAKKCSDAIQSAIDVSRNRSDVLAATMVKETLDQQRAELQRCFDVVEIKMDMDVHAVEDKCVNATSLSWKNAESQHPVLEDYQRQQNEMMQAITASKHLDHVEMLRNLNACMTAALAYAAKVDKLCIILSLAPLLSREVPLEPFTCESPASESLEILSVVNGAKQRYASTAASQQKLLFGAGLALLCFMALVKWRRCRQAKWVLPHHTE